MENDIKIGQVYLTDNEFVFDQFKNQPIIITNIDEYLITYMYINSKSEYIRIKEDFIKRSKPFPQYNTPLYKAINS